MLHLSAGVGAAVIGHIEGGGQHENYRVRVRNNIILVPGQEEGEDALSLVAAWCRAARRHLQHQDDLLDCLQSKAWRLVGIAIAD
jgi:hypothetical protein